MCCITNTNSPLSLLFRTKAKMTRFRGPRRCIRNMHIGNWTNAVQFLRKWMLNNMHLHNSGQNNCTMTVDVKIVMSNFQETTENTTTCRFAPRLGSYFYRPDMETFGQQFDILTGIIPDSFKRRHDSPWCNQSFVIQLRENVCTIHEVCDNCFDMFSMENMIVVCISGNSYTPKSIAADARAAQRKARREVKVQTGSYFPACAAGIDPEILALHIAMDETDPTPEILDLQIGIFS